MKNNQKIESSTWKCNVCDCLWEQTNAHYSDKCVYGMQLCGKHYTQLSKNGKITDKKRSRKNDPRVCDICESVTRVTYMSKENKYQGFLLCSKHRNQVNRHNRIFDRTIFDKNEITAFDDRAEIALYNKHGEIVGIAKIDLDDIEKISSYKWGLLSNGYADSEVGYLHKYLVDYKLVDHINRDRLDNRKSNLRDASNSENAINSGIRSDNTSGIIGVGWIKPDSCWCARFEYMKEIRLYKSGFKDKRNAIIQRLRWEQEYCKEFAPQRHLFAEYGITEEDADVDKQH